MLGDPLSEPNQLSTPERAVEQPQLADNRLVEQIVPVGRLDLDVVLLSESKDHYQQHPILTTKPQSLRSWQALNLQV